jgi:hypothetical protein
MATYEEGHAERLQKIDVDLLLSSYRAHQRDAETERLRSGFNSAAHRICLEALDRYEAELTRRGL